MRNARHPVIAKGAIDDDGPRHVQDGALAAHTGPESSTR